ncbi:MAG: DUF4340 domain-containing protein [Gammaproteobacteria bacterium]|nr:DUF4340 domain-containing protein [Gammaproteobacteria bacterium]MCF6259739.1 DUF4340 domain-containing protein [Gammaproteobacteria bacterium]
MSPKTLLNIFLALILAGLLALVIYEPGKTESPETKKFTALNPDTVQEISIESPGRPPLLLTKKFGHWHMQKPLMMPANTGRIQQLLKITQAKSIADYAMSRVDANQLQLDSPSLSLKLDNVLLRFGTTDALGGSRYVQVGNTVHLITDRYSHLMKRAATEFVSPTLLPQGSVIEELILPDLRLTQQDGRWSINGHKDDADAIQMLLDEWRYARALRVSLIDKDTAAVTKENIVVSIGNDSDKQIFRFIVLRSETGIILQRAEPGIQYHFPLEAGQRLLSLPTTIEPVQ